MAYRVGVDVGGTFTDLALYDTKTGKLEFGKTSSTPQNQSIGVANGIRDLAARLKIPAGEIQFFIHGTTVATNTMLERKGAKTALIVTKGFRDVLEIGKQDRPSLYDWRVRRPDPLVPRHLRFEVTERMLHTGEVLTPLDKMDLAATIEEIRKAEVQAIAVCLLHSYANPAHEKAIGEAIKKAMPDVKLSLSHEVLPEFKEYDRMSTTTINAYVGPVMERYLTRLQKAINDVGVQSDVYIMQSNGGTTSAGHSAERPVQTILSGPAAGVIGSNAIANQAGEMNVISVDMGGTSFDICLAYKGQIRRTKESEIERLTVKVPMVDINTLGAGGGSIAWIDQGGALRVGPRSAGAQPGPACYGRGGTVATVTDANLVLGRLGKDSLLGGTMTLDIELARKAIQDNIAGPLKLGLDEAAEGIIRVVNAGMIKGIRVVSIARGYDPREFALVAFGGAGPVHAAELAFEMDIPRVLVPIAPGVTSAMGLLMADMRHDFVRTVLKPGNEIQPASLTAWYEELEREAIDQMNREKMPEESVTLVRLAEMRYVGQGYEIDTPLPPGKITMQQFAEASQRFHDAHKQRYGYSNPANPVEVVNLRLTAIAATPSPRLEAAPLKGSKDPAKAVKSQRQVYFKGKRSATNVYDRPKLRPGDRLTGPAIVEQLDATTVIWPHQSARVDAYRNIIIEQAAK
ncbi:MAG: hydantoinase/oxoprolinase family protein [SAR202 cluster bacterium]|nr:hydantoinase/oxoprolinase family protein [SAR202 cluster bacterium]